MSHRLLLLAALALPACGSSTTEAPLAAPTRALSAADPVVEAAAAGADVPGASAADAAGAASGAAAEAADRTNGMRTVAFPGEDPGAPLYSRVTPLMNQIFIDGDVVAIPIYRDPACIPADADLFAHMFPPGPDGPGAFACPLLVEGHYLIEQDAPPGTFPVRSVTTGPAQVWFVARSAFEAAGDDGVLRMAELRALDPLRGTATSFHEVLSPRLDRHHLVITSRGTLEDGRSFRFDVNHVGPTTRSILIRIG